MRCPLLSISFLRVFKNSYNFERALRLASSDGVDGNVFIVNTGGHYVVYALENGTWYFHDSMKSRGFEVPHRSVLAALAQAADGKRKALGRRVVHFVRYI